MNNSIELIRDVNYETGSLKLAYSRPVAVQLQRFGDIMERNLRFSTKPTKPIDVLVLQPLFGFHSQGMRTIEDDRIWIRLWGKRPLMLIHELAHCFFPSKSQALHEGLADFFQHTYENLLRDRYVELIQQLFSLYEIHDPSEVFTLWSNSQNCDNTRNNLMLITRIINLLFTGYLIDSLGYEAYFEFHNNPSSGSMEALFHSFSETLCTANIKIPNVLKKLKLRHDGVSNRWTAFEQFGLPASGNPMKFLKSVRLSKAQNAEALKIYKDELWLYNAWCKAGHIR